MSESIPPYPDSRRSPTDASLLLSRYGFYFSILLFVYVTLFPFSFDISRHALAQAWARVGFVLSWYAPIYRIPDAVANILLTMPFGFFGLLHRAGRGKTRAVWWWCAMGLALGLGAEILQLAIPTRSSGVTDVISNGLGAYAGAALARTVGERVLTFLTGSASERRNIYLWMLAWSMVAILGPFDVSPNYLAHFKSQLQMFRANPWALGASAGVEWVRMAGLALIGALASRLAVPGRRKRSLGRLAAALSLVLLLPLVLTFARLLVESYPPSLRDLTMELSGAVAGFAIGLCAPASVHPFPGFLLMNLALIAAGLSPFRFAAWQPGCLSSGYLSMKSASEERQPHCTKSS